MVLGGIHRSSMKKVNLLNCNDPDSQEHKAVTAKLLLSNVSDSQKHKTATVKLLNENVPDSQELKTVSAGFPCASRTALVGGC